MTASEPETARVAVVVPCFNDGRTLGDAVASVHAQAVPVELVVVDDGSDDSETLEALAALERDGVRVVHQPNAGLAAARMAGVHATTAPYVLPLDADDILELGAASRLAAALDAAPAAAVAWGDIEAFGATTGRIPSAPSFDPWLLTYTSMIPAGSMVRREALEAVGGWQVRDEPEDWDLWLSIAEAGFSGVYVHGVAYRYRRTLGPRLGMARARELTTHYETLRERHEPLFAARGELRDRSSAPETLKLALSALERLPGPRLAKVQLGQLLTLLLWNHELRATGRMAAEAVRLRVSRRREG